MFGYNTRPRMWEKLIKPIHKDRMLTLSNFPQRCDSYNDSTKLYLRKHGLKESYVNSLSTCYPTKHGICFVLTGKLLFQERRCDGIMPAVNNPHGVTRDGAIYMPEPDNPFDELVIVEGPADAIAVSQEGYRSVALLGANPDNKALAYISTGLVRSPNKTFFIPDNDKPGLSLIVPVVREMPRVRILILPTPFKDICDMPQSMREQFLSPVGVDRRY